MKEEKRKAVWKNVRDFVDYIVTPIAIVLLAIFVFFAMNKALGMGVFERYGIAATRDDITEAVYDAVKQIAPAWVSGTEYTANALVSYNGVVYRCKANTVSPHTTTPDADTAHWEAKPVSKLFLPLTGGEMPGALTVPGILLTNGVIFYNDMSFSLSPYSGGTLALIEHIAPDYSASSAYEVGQLVVQGFRLKKCTTAGTGSAAVFTPATVEDVLAALRTDKANRAEPDHAGNLAALDAEGNPTDSGIPKSDAITTSSAAWIDVINRLHQLEMQM